MQLRQLLVHHLLGGRLRHVLGIMARGGEELTPGGTDRLAHILYLNRSRKLRCARDLRVRSHGLDERARRLNRVVDGGHRARYLQVRQSPSTRQISGTPRATSSTSSSSSMRARQGTTAYLSGSPTLRAALRAQAMTVRPSAAWSSRPQRRPSRRASDPWEPTPR